MKKNKFSLHETSIVDDNCTIGENTSIWHYSHVQNNVKIGENCTLGQNVNIGSNVDRFLFKINAESCDNWIPAKIAIYCLPSTENDIGGALIP